ncbi:PD-(D/E)XK nuclease superfamily protein [Streptomyces acidiscabies]|nr:PD-(D/E)XK nuclease superfamily protein [Streptomyces acidiscabies]
MQGEGGVPLGQREPGAGQSGGQVLRANPSSALGPGGVGGEYPLTPEDARTIASWDRDLDALTGELLRARRAVTDVPLPAVLTASQVMRLAEDHDGLAQELARPMPQPPKPAARRGTRFHAWVEARWEALTLPLLEPEELPGTEDAEIDDERDLEELKEAFERTAYAHRTPHRVEAPFQLSLAGRVVRGRIDAVYKEGDGATASYEIVDWKTHRERTADPLQLALYRLAWAEQEGVPVESVTAAFLYVRTGDVVRPPELPGRAALERILRGAKATGEPLAEVRAPGDDVGAAG